MTDLEKLLFGALGGGIVAIATFAVRLVWVVLPRYLAQNERNTRANELTANTVAWLPHILSTQELRFENALQRGLAEISRLSGAETERTRVLFEQMFDRMQEAIERRLSGQEDALHANQVELARANRPSIPMGAITAKSVAAHIANELDPPSSPTLVSPESRAGRARASHPSAPGC